MLVKKELLVGNTKFADLSLLDSVKELGVTSGMARCTKYSATHNDISFNIESWSGAGTNSVEMFIDDRQFPTKIALIRFYRAVKTLVVKS